jgi:hypothetical protein
MMASKKITFGMQCANLIERMTGGDMFGGEPAKMLIARSADILHTRVVYTAHDEARIALVERAIGRNTTDVERYTVYMIARSNTAFRMVGAMHRTLSDLTPEQRHVLGGVVIALRGN